MNALLLQSIFSLAALIPLSYMVSQYLIEQKIRSFPLFWGLLALNLYVNFSLYYFFIGTLLVTIFSDFQYFLISRFVTLYLVPVVWIYYFFAYPITFLKESVIMSLTSFAFLWSVRYISLHIFKKDGLGQGDVDLLTYIASVTGFWGTWFSLMFGSIFAILCTLPQIIIYKNPKIPYGAYMAFAALLFAYLFKYPQIITFITPVLQLIPFFQ